MNDPLESLEAHYAEVWREPAPRHLGTPKPPFWATTCGAFAPLGLGMGLAYAMVQFFLPAPSPNQMPSLGPAFEARMKASGLSASELLPLPSTPESRDRALLPKRTA